MRRRLRLAATLSLVLGLHAASHAGILCQSRTGTLKGRSACRSLEKQLDPATVGVQPLPGPGIVVRDSNDALVGVVFTGVGTGGSQIQAVRKIDGVAVVFNVTHDGFVDVGSPPEFRYESTDCSGPTLIGGIVDMLSASQVAGGTAYYVVPPSRVFHQGSASLTGFTQAQCDARGGAFTAPDRCCIADADDISGGTLGTVDVTGFVPPFRIDGP